MNSAYAARRDICEVGRRTYLSGFVAANDGNISGRIGDDRVLCTPTGVSKGFLTEDMLAICDMNGKQVSGQLKISSEIGMHLEVYRMRPDIHSVVHAHPPAATGFAVAGIDLTQCVLPEVVIALGGIPLAQYGTPGGPDLFEPMRPLVKDYDAVLMANHGVVTFGRSIMEAHFKMETVEHFAKIALVAQQLGGTKILDQGQVQDLVNLRGQHGITDRPSCNVGVDIPSATPAAGADIVEEITREVMRRLQGG